MTTLARNTSVFDLLDRARVAHTGAGYAWGRRDTPEATRLEAKAKVLVKEAQAVDPSHESPAWGANHEWMAEVEKAT